MGLVIGGTSNGIGRHIQFLEKEMEAATYSIMLMRIAEFMLIISTVFVKISISLFLKRLLYVSSLEALGRTHLANTIVLTTTVPPAGNGRLSSGPSSYSTL